jgi:hypothetical protein
MMGTNFVNSCLICVDQISLNSMAGEEQETFMKWVWLHGKTCYKNYKATTAYSNLYQGNKKQFDFLDHHNVGCSKLL